ncbi:hypothetical protein CLOP_g11299 [Closterium sp. NIES-67]|nr:hypothetical protein CLOP_g11299 [Closterium sp. NIES-67]
MGGHMGGPGRGGPEGPPGAMPPEMRRFGPSQSERFGPRGGGDRDMPMRPASFSPSARDFKERARLQGGVSVYGGAAVAAAARGDSGEVGGHGAGQEGGAARKVVEDLVVRLCSEPKPALFTWAQIEQGLVRVFQDLEDWSVDAPKAPQHVGRLIGRLVAAGAIPLADVARLVKAGGAEEGSLVEMGEGIKVMVAVVEAGPEGFMDERARGRKEKVEEARKALGLAGAADPLEAVAAHLTEGLAKGEPAEAVLKWLQANTPPDAVSSPAFPRLLMRSLLQHAIGSSTADFKKLLEGPVKKYAKVFQQYASGKQKANQIQYLFGAQEFAESRRHPQGLLAAVFRALYDLDVVDEPMFFKWQDDNKDPTPGKQKAYLDVRNFLNWLSTAPEEGMEENGASGEEDS